jgi:hypothetical protein
MPACGGGVLQAENTANAKPLRWLLPGVFEEQCKVKGTGQGMQDGGHCVGCLDFTFCSV